MPLINFSNYLCESWKWKITLDRIVRFSEFSWYKDSGYYNNVEINEQVRHPCVIVLYLVTIIFRSIKIYIFQFDQSYDLI